MSRAGWSKAASLQVVVVPWRQKHQKIPGSGPRHQSKAMCFPDSKAAEWDCSTGNCLIWAWLLVYLSDWWNTRPQRELNMPTGTECDLCSWQTRLAGGEGVFFYVSVYCHLLSCRVTEEQESMEASLMLLFYFEASSLPGLVLYFCPYVIF